MALGLIIGICKAYFLFVVVLMVIYSGRHMLFAFDRMFGRQRLYYSDICTTELPSISVLVPMHNEEQVLHFVLDALLECRYDRDRLEIIPINDNSSDRTKELLEEYHARYPFIRPLHRDCAERGKPVGLNDAMELATGDVIIVFDADYRPSKDMLVQLALAFQDAEAGAVMGRVIPYNANKNMLTRLLNIERSGGYQADQQARYNLKTIPQYGGTVGGFRKAVICDMGGFNPRVLAEDTELTYRFYTQGWKVIYANSAECYEEAPEQWEVRGRQVRRWSRGHNNVMFRYLPKIVFNQHMNLRERIDGALLLIVYAVPALLALGVIVSVYLFYLGEMNVLAGWWVLLFIGAYNSFGNFAPFYEIASAFMMDGTKGDLRLLPLLTFSFYFYLWYIMMGFLDNLGDVLFRRKASWDKTVRYAKGKNSDSSEPEGPANAEAAS